MNEDDLMCRILYYIVFSMLIFEMPLEDWSYIFTVKHFVTEYTFSKTLSLLFLMLFVVILNLRFTFEDN